MVECGGIQTPTHVPAGSPSAKEYARTHRSVVISQQLICTISCHILRCFHTYSLGNVIQELRKKWCLGGHQRMRGRDGANEANRWDGWSLSSDCVRERGRRRFGNESSRHS